MPQWDRWWPLGIVGGLVLLTAGAALALWRLASLFGLPAQVGLPPLNTLGTSGGGAVVSEISGGAALLSGSLAARRRVRARRAARLGDMSMMAPSIVSADIAKPQDIGELPITFIWRRQPKGSDAGPFLFVALLFSAAPACLLILPALFQLDMRSVFFNDTFTVPDFVALAMLMSFEAILGIAAWVGLFRAIFSRLGPEYAVRADSSGIRAVHLLGEGPLLHWSSVRVFEVSQPFIRPHEHMYSLSGTGATVWWLDVPKRGSGHVAAEIERQDHLRRLLALVVARTGMQPVTCTPTLALDEPKGRPPRRYRMLAHAVAYGIPVVLFALAGAVLALPLTPFVLLNGYAAASTALLGIAMIVATRHAFDPPRPGAYLLPAAPALLAEQVEIIYRRRRATGLPSILIGVLLLLNLVPVFAAYSSLAPSPLWAFAVKIVAGLLFVVSILGGVVIIDGLSSGRTRLRITGAGLSQTHGRQITWLPWDAIAVLKLETERGAPVFFSALHTTGEAITWPARNVIWRGSGRAPAPVSPEELAALVAARSGVHLTVG